MFQLNSPNIQTCYQHNSSEDIIGKAKKVAWEYNKQHLVHQWFMAGYFSDANYMYDTFISEVDSFCLQLLPNVFDVLDLLEILLKVQPCKLKKH